MDNLQSLFPDRSMRPTRSNNSATREMYKDKKTLTKAVNPKKTITPNNLEEKRPQKEKEDSDAHEDHKPSSTAKTKTRPTIKSKIANTQNPEIDAEAVPVPAPDAGLSSTKTLAVHTGILPVISSPTTLSVPPYTLGSGFSSLPPLTALATSTVLSEYHPPTGSPDESRALSADEVDRSTGAGSKHLSVVLIVLVTVGVAFLIMGGLICWRMRSRPRKRSCPTPSRPILQDPFADQDLKADEESLFGGKERGSALARPNSNGLYNWVPYTPKPSEALAALGSKNTSPNPPLVPAMPAPPTALLSEKAVQPSTSGTVPLPVTNLSSNPPMQQMQSALTRAANRVSALSMSIYPASPQSTNAHTGIGLAIGGTSPLTADGSPVLERKPSKDRLSKSRRSFRHSLAATEYLDLYSGAQLSAPDPASPLPAPTAPLKSALRKSTSYAQGRARVKAGYIPGTTSTSTTLRASSTVAGITTLGRHAGDRSSVLGAPSEELQYILPPLSPALKSDTRRERDTRALTCALGLASPVPTLTPDDSITLAGERQRAKHGTGAEYVHSETMSPTIEASARLGNLMLAEFTSMASLPSTRNVAGGATSGSGPKRVVPRKNVNASARTDDRPPRVPSPPPLPSLAQMALAHSNPEEYADYRSPTYSIYGLYEAERKSRMQPGDGDF